MKQFLYLLVGLSLLKCGTFGLQLIVFFNYGPPGPFERFFSWFWKHPFQGADTLFLNIFFWTILEALLLYGGWRFWARPKTIHQ